MRFGGLVGIALLGGSLAVLAEAACVGEDTPSAAVTPTLDASTSSGEPVVDAGAAPGSTLWAVQFDVTSSGQKDGVSPSRLATLPDGSVILAGTYGGSIAIDGQAIVSKTAREGFVARFDRDGKKVWFQPIPTDATYANAVSIVSDLALDSQGDVIVSGACSGTCKVGGITTTQSTAISLSYYVAKLKASDGSGLWLTPFVVTKGDVGDEAPRVSMESISAHGTRIALGGNFVGNLQIGLFAAKPDDPKNGDAFLALLDANGTPSLVSKGGGSAGTGTAKDSSEHISGLALVDDGAFMAGLFSAHHFNGFGLSLTKLTTDAAPSADAFITKIVGPIDGGWNPAPWQRAFAGSDTGAFDFRAVAAMPGGGAAFVGDFNYFDGDVLGKATDYPAGTDGLLVTVNAVGEATAIRRYGGTGAESLGAVAVNEADGDIIVGGRYTTSEVVIEGVKMPLLGGTLHVGGFAHVRRTNGTIITIGVGSPGSNEPSTITAVGLDPSSPRAYAAGYFTGHVDLGLGPTSSGITGTRPSGFIIAFTR